MCHNKSVIVALSAAAFFLISAAPVVPISRIKADFAKFLKDPMSAQIQILRQKSIGSGTESRLITCGKFNAKNSYGAYTGFKSFAFDPTNGGTLYTAGTIVRPNGEIKDADAMSDEEITDLSQITGRLDRLDKHFSEIKSVLGNC